MFLNKHSKWWLLSIVIMSIILVIDFLLEYSISPWLFFVWLYNLNFLVYSIFNGGELVMKSNGQKSSSVLESFHNSVSFLKFLLILVFLVVEIFRMKIPYFYILVVVVLILDIAILLFRSKVRHS